MPINMTIEYPKLQSEIIMLRYKNEQLQEDYNILQHKYTDAVMGLNRITRIVKKSLDRFANCKTESDLHKAILTLKTI